MAWVYIGQTLMALAGPFIVNCITKVSLQWFTQRNRIKMTTLMSSSYMFGLGIGFLFTTLSLGDNADLEIKRYEIKNIMQISAISCFFVSLPIFIFYREEPEIAPSASAKTKREGLIYTTLRELANNKDYMLLSLVFGLSLANIISIILMIHHVVAPFNYSELQISLIGVIINFSSGISKCIVGFIAGKYISLNKLIMYIFIGILLCFMLFYYSLTTGNIEFVYFACVMFGFFCQMYWGPSLEYAAELAFPVSETISTGNLLFIGCIFGMITNSFVSILYSAGTTGNGFLMYLVVSYAACVIITYLISSRLRREEFEIYGESKANYISKG
jgi:FLVCR family feline leukemia virus subgroup C receptor-related protein